MTRRSSLRAQAREIYGALTAVAAARIGRHVRQPRAVVPCCVAERRSVRVRAGRKLVSASPITPSGRLFPLPNWGSLQFGTLKWPTPETSDFGGGRDRHFQSRRLVREASAPDGRAPLLCLMSLASGGLVHSTIGLNDVRVIE